MSVPVCFFFSFFFPFFWGRGVLPYWFPVQLNGLHFLYQPNDSVWNGVGFTEAQCSNAAQEKTKVGRQSNWTKVGRQQSCLSFQQVKCQGKLKKKKTKSCKKLRQTPYTSVRSGQGSNLSSSYLDGLTPCEIYK